MNVIRVIVTSDDLKGLDPLTTSATRAAAKAFPGSTGHDAGPWMVTFTTADGKPMRASLPSRIRTWEGLRQKKVPVRPTSFQLHVMPVPAEARPAA